MHGIGIISIAEYCPNAFIQLARFFMSNSDSARDKFVLSPSLRKQMQIQSKYDLTTDHFCNLIIGYYFKHS